MRSPECGMDEKSFTTATSSFRVPHCAFRNSSLSPLAIGRGDLAEKLNLVQTFARAFRDRAKRIFRNVHRQARLFTQQAIEPAQERAAAREHQAAIDQIGGKLRRTTFERDPDR